MSAQADWLMTQAQVAVIKELTPEGLVAAAANLRALAASVGEEDREFFENQAELVDEYRHEHGGGPLPDTLRPQEAAQLLGVSRTWLHVHTKDGTVPSFHVGTPEGPVRYSRRALQAVMYHHSNRQDAEQEAHSGRQPHRRRDLT